MKLGRRPSTGPGGTCRSCRAPIVWALTETGRKMPVDLEPVPLDGLLAEMRSGNLILWYEVNDKGHPIGPQNVRSATAEEMRDRDTPIWRSHFVTCPSATVHRRARP